MILVDTSVWIDLLRERDTARTAEFRNLLERGSSFGVTSAIYQEVLQGAASEQDFEQIASNLGSQRFYHPKDRKTSYEAAARLYFRCRRAGITIRSTIDCLIAQIAIEHELLLLHDDKDFARIADVTPELKLFERTIV